jgi:hypothetical protein
MMSKDSETPPPPGGQFLVYQTEDGKLKIDVRFEGETVWLTQQHMAELFQTTQQNISLHLQNIYAEGELQLEATHKESLSVRQEGGRTVRRRVDFYNLDAILSVGYRVKPDVSIAKNYLSEPELEALNNLVEQYLIFAQGQAMRRVPMHMADWIEKLNGFLTLNDRDILAHAGRISHEMAQAKAELEYDKFKALTASAPRAVDADFEQATKDLKKLPKPKKPKPPES